MTSTSFCKRLTFFAAVWLVALTANVWGAEIDAPESVDLGDPIVLSILDEKPDAAGTVVWHVFTAKENTCDTHQFADQLAVWCKRACELKVIAVYIPTDGVPEKLEATITVGEYIPDVDDPRPTPVKDVYGMIKVARDAGKDANPLLRRLLSQVFSSVGQQLATQYKTDAAFQKKILADQVAALQAATVDGNRKAIKEEERANIIPTLTTIMNAINDNQKVDSFEAYLAVWHEISVGLSN